MSIFQLGAVCFALFMLYLVRIFRIKSALSRFEVFFWSTIWIIFGIIALFPQLLLGIAGILHFQRVFDLLVVIAFMILSVVSIVNYFHNKATMNVLETLVRKLAIDDTTQSKKKVKRNESKKK